MNYEEWESIKIGDRVECFLYGKGTVISSIGVGYVVKFDKGNTVKIQDGSLKKLTNDIIRGRRLTNLESIDQKTIDEVLKPKASTFEMSIINEEKLMKNGGYHNPYNNNFSKQVFSYNKDEYTTHDLKGFLMRNAEDVPIFVGGKRVCGIEAKEDAEGNIVGYNLLLEQMNG